MAKEKKDDVNTNPMASSQAILNVLLKANTDKHLNFEEETYYKVSTGSLQLDCIIDGGLPPGIHRFCGFTEGGKTSAALEVARNFLSTVPKSRGFLVKSEGRLSPTMKLRSGLKFVSKAEEWVYGTIFVLESTDFEFVADMMRAQINDARISGDKIIFIIDSLDAMMRSEDIEKGAKESTKVAGGTVILSDLLRRINLVLCKFGHMGIFISQVRSKIKIDPYAKETPTLTSGSGGNAALHYANFIFDFQERFKKDMILEDEKAEITPENPPLGHYAKIIILKSGNETSKIKLSYPIKYGRNNGSVWVEKEVVEMLISWEYVKKGGSWLTPSDELKKILSEASLPEMPMIQGEKKIFQYLSDNKPTLDFLVNFFKKQTQGV